ncbi:MAG: NFACT RNA binding domain-containing protein [Desulfovermiculus sp.]
MEANFFRFLVQQIVPDLHARRVNKIYHPQPGTWTLQLGTRVHLICVAGKRHQALFVSEHKPKNPQTPPADVGWWRKRVQGRKIVACKFDWASRRLALGLNTVPGTWLVLDVQTGLSLAGALENNFGQEPQWPSWDQIMNQSRIFRDFPHITPPLRHTLTVLNEQSGRELLQYLQTAATPEIMTWAKPKTSQGQDWLVPWLVPAQLGERFSRIHIYHDPAQAAEDYGWSVLLNMDSIQSGAESSWRRRRKKLLKQFTRVAEDEDRLKTMRGRQEQAELIKGSLYQLDPEAKVVRLELMDDHGQLRNLQLDPQKSIRENMEDFFHQAKKGRRGLEHVARRRQEVERALAAVDSGNEPGLEGAGPCETDHITGEVPEVQKKCEIKGLHVYTSSDGLYILRGKNKQANHDLLTRVARPYDLWFHAADGPGAHVILRRPGPSSDVPEASRREAATIAALRSHFAQAGKAEVMCAHVKHVSPIKGKKPGQVKVREVLETLRVSLDPGLEERLQTI